MARVTKTNSVRRLAVWIYNCLMKRWLVTAAMASLLISAPALAQRGGGAGRGGVAHSSFAARGFSGGFGSSLSFRSSGFGASRFGGVSVSTLGGRLGTSFRPHYAYSNRYYGRRFYGYPWIYPYVGAYYVDPDFYSDYSYAPPETNYPAMNASGYYDQDAEYRQDEINRLEDEVAQLRAQRAAQNNSAANSQPQPATVLIFNDKHTEQVQNYAIVGETLWIFNEEHARKIPVSNLDLPATQKANEDRGADFRLPQ